MGVGRVGADDQDHVGLRRPTGSPGCRPRCRRSASARSPSGEWQTRAQVSTLLLPNAARTIFWTTYTSSLVHRDEEMPPIDAGAVLAPGSRVNRRATKPIASSHSTSRHVVGDLLAHHRREHPVRVGGVAEGEPALDAGVALVGAAVLVRHHPHDLVAAQLGLERAADAAVGAGRHRPSGSACRARRPTSPAASTVGQACTQAPHETHSESMNGSPAPADTLESKPRPAMVSANVPWISSQARTQREQTMHLHGSKSKYGLLVSFVGVEVVVARRSRSGPRAARRRRPCPAARSRRWPGRSGSPAGGRRCRAP